MAEVYNPGATLAHDSQNLTQAVDALYAVIRDGLREHRKVHWETAISAAGFLAGVTLLRHSGAKFPGKKPGDPVDVEGTSGGALYLIEMMRGLCAEASLGREGGWLDPIPKENRPNKKMSDLVTQFEPKFRGIVMECGIEEKLQPGAAAMAAVKFIREGRAELHVDIGKAIAAASVVRATKVVPPPSQAPVMPKPSKPWWKIW